MKDLIVVIITTITVATIWVVTETNKMADQNYAPENLLEISLPIDGTIDTEFLSSLKKPAYE